ncbi:related to carboxylesterase type B [Phialocephala subalpina]|uniref:Carboxylic ester hydrolase n=1 Tax=Phialocephala subalpina TaxID=576137 RepID=A0A1L7X0T1_9HELO|nr:related to carboxylesterase type B [Phialocephala subalpina]
MLITIVASVLIFAVAALTSPVGTSDEHQYHGQPQQPGPRVTIKNGTLRGIHLPAFNEDVFLGIPFAAPPVGELRLRRPESHQNSWKGVRNATVRSPSCPGYAGFDIGLELGEDCLTVDIVRPSGTVSDEGLPVLVWIYGGGFDAGGSADPRYNTSYLVNASVAIHKPIILVSINYRIGGWGFLASKEVVAAGESNIGLFDQRLALKWIQENIGAFGGDPDKVTIAGESAGGFSVGYHLTAFDGKHDSLFRAAIMQSGNALGPGINSVSQLNTTYQPIYDNVTEAVGCSNRTDSLACLRTVPYEALFAAFSPFVMTPILDSEFLTRLPSESFSKGLVANVAILAGSNTDEGTATFFGPRDTLNTDEDVHALVAGLGNGLDNDTVSKIMDLYPDNPEQGCPFNTGSERFASQGYMFKRGAAIVGDEVIHAGRRFITKYYSSLKSRTRKPVYSYRFDQSPWNGIEVLVATVAPVYSTHYSEICFVFNIDPSVSTNNTNWIGPYPEYHDLSNLISRSWISFVHDLDPNNHGVRGVPNWPEYSKSASNLVFRVNGTVTELDNWRGEQLEFWAEIWNKLKT